MTDWAATGEQAARAVEAVLGRAWGRVSGPAMAQLGAMAQIAAQMELDYASVPPQLDEAEYRLLSAAQRNALQGILSAYEAIGLLAAEQAADAAWAVFAAALSASIPFV